LSIRPAVPEYWRATPAERTPFFEETGLIDHQHPAAGITQDLDHAPAHVIA
jgi:hypothetical protein